MSDITQTYMAIIRNITPHAPIDLDGVIGTQGAPSTEVVAQMMNTAPPSKALWQRPDDDTSYIGIRITAPIAAQEQVAMSMAAIAVERQIMPVFMSWIGNCGLQRFGFRVEHVAGKRDADKLAAEEQLKRLWNLAIVIDANDVSAF